ncbi:oligoketide cyclase/lipid transporter protein [Legionella geestiana]|uniref:Oligoketide cyclase/lipid transporter protein n=1 Tax=Legionella geestiana TaxID=45065 RepID=A0A0W0U8D7_9GAMM|nr:type II toxin-antitoxin system RatA family toxin [Legionella geestiana]KTD04069.1 oligoketide cyclase/lipid transporter protein [Legionella geestiana]QBS12083.1 type II toxin-antitoxin system RatA family toxin [Legionella geestiana]QDQ40310.1 type II toxin-antitoxin system RatA family toxin [Legionella geestiana]STX53196.1 Oligoketide cyclase/lipid transport protein [Legionella geestiana]
MTVVSKSRVVPYTCQQMYDLVNAIESYPDFLPYCSGSKVHHRDADEVQATLEISAAGFGKSFTTRNLLQPNKMIEIRLVDGPFSHLEGFWRFDAENEGCRVSFDLEFEFAGGFLSRLLGPVFEQVTDKMVDAFCDRAAAIHVAG